MRTKTLILAGAVAVLGATTTFAQVYSQNTVGFYTINLVQGFNLVANQMNNGDNTINTIMPGTTPLPDGASLLRWDAANQTFDPNSDLFFAGTGWINLGTGELSTTVLNPGEGCFLELGSAASIVLVGDVPEGTLNRNLVPGFQIISQLTPQTLGLDASAFPANDGDTLQFWNTGRWVGEPTGGYTQGYLYFAGSGWLSFVSGGFEDVVPQLGEAMFYSRGQAGGNATWTRTFDVSP